MNERTGFDRQLTAWLDTDGPGPVAADVVHAALATARTRMQRRRLAWRRSRLRSVALVLGLLVVAGAGMATIAAIRLTTPEPPVTVAARNGLIAFSSGGDIKVADPDGSNVRTLVASPSDDVVGTWSPDGSRLAYWAFNETTPVLVLVDATGRELASLPRPGWQPDHGRSAPRSAWSPDGRSIAIVERKIGPSPVRAISLVGVERSGDTVVLTAPAGPLATGTDPAWSPDGRWLAYHRTEAATYLGSPAEQPVGLGLVAADGTSDRLLSTDWVSGDYIRWHRGGDAVDFGGDGGVWTIGVPAGGDQRWFEIGPGHAVLQGPLGSPDGSMIAYLVDGPEGLSVAEADGGHARSLGVTDPAGAPFGWSPDASHLIATVWPASADAPTGLVLLDLDGREAPVTIPIDTDVHVPYFDWQRAP